MNGFRPKLPISDLIPKCAASGIVLDIGTGQGYFMSILKSKGYIVVGTDINLHRLKIAKFHGDVILADSQNLPFKNNSFDIISSIGLLHHVEEPIVVLNEIRRCMKLKGLLYLEESTENNPIHSILRRIHPYYNGDTVKSKFKKKQLKDLIKKQEYVIKYESSFGGNVYWIFYELVNRLPQSRLYHLLLPTIIIVERTLIKISTEFSSWYQAIITKK